jgi:hypothetical protein
MRAEERAKKQKAFTVFQPSLKRMRVLNRLIRGATAFVALVPLIALTESPKSTMKAVLVHEYGGPEVLKLEEVPRPELKKDQILARMIAAGVNPVDGMLRAGMFCKTQ